MTKILFVDINAQYLENMRRYLSWYDFEVDALTDSKQAWDLLIKNEYDLFICDLFSRPIDGFSLIKDIRNFPRKNIRNTNILMISEEKMSLDKQIILKHYQAYYMTKYKSMEKWFSKITAILSHLLKQTNYYKA